MRWKKNIRCGVAFDDIFISSLLYADDIALIAGNEQDLKRMLNALSEGLKMENKY